LLFSYLQYHVEEMPLRLTSVQRRFTELRSTSIKRRILLAVRDPFLAGALREALLRARGIELAGIVDPTIDRALDGWSAHADVLLIGADELLWLQRSCSRDPLPAASAMRVVVLLDEARILDVVKRIDRRVALVFECEDAHFLAERIDLAVAGYVVLSAELLARWAGNHLRRRLVDGFSPNERRILDCVGRALSNKGIAAETGFAQNQVKALVQSVTRKLRMKNRTTVAIFAATMPPAALARQGADTTIASTDNRSAETSPLASASLASVSTTASRH